MIEFRSGGCETTSAEWDGTAGVCIHVDFHPSITDRIAHGALGRLDLPIRHELFDERVARLVFELAREAKDGRPHGALYSEGLSLCLLSLLSEAYGKPKRKGDERVLAPNQAKRLIEYIDQHIGGDLSVQSLAAELGISSFILAKQFTATFAQSLHQYVLSRRIDKASEALRNNRSESIGQIALDHGFSSHAHFSATCRRLLGVPPGQLRLEKE